MKHGFFQKMWLAGALLLIAPACGSDRDNGGHPPPAPVDALQVDKVVLGKLLFFDTNLSKPAGQSCASCHDPETGFADPQSDLPVSQGAIPSRVGSRNTPTLAYSAFSPSMYFHSEKKLWFWWRS